MGHVMRARSDQFTRSRQKKIVLGMSCPAWVHGVRGNPDVLVQRETPGRPPAGGRGTDPWLTNCKATGTLSDRELVVEVPLTGLSSRADDETASWDVAALERMLAVA